MPAGRFVGGLHAIMRPCKYAHHTPKITGDAMTKTSTTTTTNDRTAQAREKLKSAVSKYMKDLDEKEMAVIRMRFGGQGNREHRPLTIAEIRAIEARAREKLKKSGRLKED